jgi:hypothetical protein
LDVADHSTLEQPVGFAQDPFTAVGHKVVGFNLLLHISVLHQLQPVGSVQLTTASKSFLKKVYPHMKAHHHHNPFNLLTLLTYSKEAASLSQTFLLPSSCLALGSGCHLLPNHMHL